ncbi:hypothetical protein [Parasedimentitalea denitrificans]|uniref:hypothetical protein n=1 Tax=Parasedimentitalea denitrificans TaxID=2211118 RepID=UPI001430732B|nr:hypothetical protein [Sedimentitalea sp. CY04]
MKRDKKRWEKFFSLSRHRRRFGAELKSLDGDYEALKTSIIDGGEVVQTRGSGDDVNAHFEALRSEFSGQPELVFEHARLIVLIRRDFKAEEAFTELKKMWEAEEEFLLEHLNLRWIVAATDSFADLDPAPENRATALSIGLMVNTMKTYESERYIKNIGDEEVDQSKVEHLSRHLVPIFSGLSMLTIGTDDTLRNMRWRIDRQAKEGLLGRVLKHVFIRLQTEDNAFARVKALHRRERTSWW